MDDKVQRVLGAHKPLVNRYRESVEVLKRTFSHQPSRNDRLHFNTHERDALAASRGLLPLYDILAILERHCFANYVISSVPSQMHAIFSYASSSSSASRNTTTTTNNNKNNNTSTSVEQTHIPVSDIISNINIASQSVTTENKHKRQEKKAEQIRDNVTENNGVVKNNKYTALTPLMPSSNSNGSDKINTSLVEANSSYLTAPYGT
ncbi:hypothetical protein O3M35_007027 [Rhynocoris fuscipes]|uniref:Uncharacterized protein n=1 Tax=Rhynocoris fuscipes TaxID=488301 RepID=A0AAW1DG40_9HEMI